jgi:hypothetical protein
MEPSREKLKRLRDICISLQTGEEANIPYSLVIDLCKGWSSGPHLHDLLEYLNIVSEMEDNPVDLSETE